MECTFAINSTAPGFVLIQDVHSQHTINTTLQRHEGDDHRGSANFVDLPTGEYRVSVYDQLEEYKNGDSPAYVHHQPIQILEPVYISSYPVSSSVSGSCNNYVYYMLVACVYTVAIYVHYHQLWIL